ncbi:MAG: Gfo/Idh/MocA family oxidoreductase [Candidatus Aminicenantales bacterium]
MAKNLAVIGCGRWGKNLIRNFHELNALRTVCDLDENRLKLFKEQYPELEATPDYPSVLESSKIKAVVISTPAATHYSLAKMALQSGKDVFVEKPIALNYREGEELVALAKARKKILMVGHLLEYHPAIIKLKEIVDSGTLGKIHYIYSNRLNLGTFRQEENILWSFAPHDISLILYLLDEMPHEISAHGGNYLNPHIADVTITNLNFPSGAKAHIFVSWLHPYKEQKLIVIGEQKMALFDDVRPNEKLFIYPHKIDWIRRMPLAHPEKAEPVKVEKIEPLKTECVHFMECIATRKAPKTDGNNGLRVLKILEMSQQSLQDKGKIYFLSSHRLGAAGNSGSSSATLKKYFIHETARVDENVKIGDGTKIWHFSHIQSGSRIGKNCVLGQNVNIGSNVWIGNSVKIQNNVSVYEGVTLEDYVFCGPSVVFTNISNPRSRYPQRGSQYYQKTMVKEGASLGANSTILCGHTIGRSAFVGAGAVVTQDVPDFALVVGNPARLVGWMSEAGLKLVFDAKGYAFCQKSQKYYKLVKNRVIEVDKERKKRVR